MDEDLAADFVSRFAEFWRAPVLERLDTVVAADARLSAPLVPTTYGLEAGKRTFRELFELIEGMHAEVHRWGTTDDGVLIEFTASGTIGGAPVSWQAVDRFVLDESGLAIERATYFDPLSLLFAVVRQPRSWGAVLATGTRRMRS